MGKPGVLSFATLVLAAGLAPAAEVTFNKDVAPILFKNCANCHRPGEVGPFPLLSYKDVAKRADFLKDITADRRMPPWKAEPGFGEFHDVRRLTDEQIHTIAAWVDGGAREGKPEDLPPAPKFTDGWQLGEPDMVLKMAQPFTLKADGPDEFRCFVIPTGLTEDKTVSAVEFRPGNRKVVHHALFFLDTDGAARAKEAQEDGPGKGFSTFGGVGILPTGSLGGWAPGAAPRKLPDGLGQRLAKGSDLVLQVHYHRDGKDEVDQSSLGIYFAKKPAEKFVGGIMLVNRKLYIPPGQERHRVTASLTLPVDTRVVGIFPHMHLVGREMKVVAVLPDGKEKPLIWIKDWDFNWQGQYRYVDLVALPKGTRLDLEAFYDNSDKNPNNPNKPPKEVTWGEQTTDEMCLCGVQVVTERPGDMAILRRAMIKTLAGRLGLLFGEDTPKPAPDKK
jgi:mono/diheme cytochrome c family protein